MRVGVGVLVGMAVLVGVGVAVVVAVGVGVGNTMSRPIEKVAVLLLSIIWSVGWFTITREDPKTLSLAGLLVAEPCGLVRFTL